MAAKFLPLAVLLALLVGTVVNAVDFRVCTYTDAECSDDEECESDDDGTCEDVDLEETFDDIGVRVMCGGSDGPHNVELYNDDDCDGDGVSKVVNSLTCTRSFDGIRSAFYFTVECGNFVCFDRKSSVLLRSGERRDLASIVPGDVVQSVDSQGKTVYSEVFLTQHDSATKATRMVQITHGNSTRPLTLTPNHYLRVPAADEKYVKAGELKIGDHILVAGGTAGDMMQEVSVTRLTKMTGKPINVHTMNDRIVVDGVVASCLAANYYRGVDVSVLRPLLFPLKLMHRVGLRFLVRHVDSAIHHLAQATS